MFSAIKKLKLSRGQSTIEAAFALPVFMILALLLLQPGIVLYDRLVMQGAAAEGCRLLATSTSSNADTNEDYIRRRLSAIPQIDQFHVHSSECSWDISLAGDETSQEVSVQISTEVKPLPLLDFGMALLGLVNANGNLEITTQAQTQSKPDWIAGSADGLDPSGWVTWHG